MKNLLATVLFTALCTCSFSQKPPIKFGDISIEDLKMTRYDKDTAAAAVVLTDFGETDFKYNENKGWQLLFERITRIKIIKKDGYKWADFSVPLYHGGGSKEKLSGLKATTYNLENGKILETKLKGDATFEERYNENIDLVKFTLPNVKEGSIIEVTYKVQSDFIFNFQDWEFQSLIPVVWSEYRAIFPEFFHYEKYMQGYVSLTVNDSKEIIQKFSVPYSSGPQRGGAIDKGVYDLTSQSMINRWVAQNVPAFKEEPFLGNYRDYVSKINFELGYIQYPNEPIKPVMGTWEDLNKNFLENVYFGSAVKGSGFLKKTVEEVTVGLSTPMEKITAIYNYVKSTVVWDGRYRKYLDDNFKRPLEEKKGSSAEINLLLTSMLQKADVVANPVIISTRDNGFVRENFALSSQFNYVICQVVIDGKSLLLDATDRMLPIHTLPARCLNGRGYIISTETSGWVPLTAPKSKVFASAEVSLTNDGKLQGKMAISNEGYFGQSVRNDYLKKGEEEYVKDFAHSKSWQIDKSEFINIDNLTASAKENYEFTYLEDFGKASIIYFNPMLHLRLDENPFKLENRMYPVDFGNAMDQTLSCRITIPENYRIEELPVSKVFSLPNNTAKFTYSVQQLGNVINLACMLSINQSLFTQTEYANLREFYNHIVAKQAEQIVLKKN